jgi:hypothetical protein
MNHFRSKTIGATCVAALTAMALVAAPGSAGVRSQERHPHFGDNSARITNPWMPVSRFKRCVLAGNDDGLQVRIVRVLQKRTVELPYRGDQVEAAVVIDRVIDRDRAQLIEKTADYFAQDRAGGVHYLGEHVDEYHHGHLVGHEGQWRLGRDTKHPGLLMPAHPQVGDHFRSEIVPEIAVEKDRILKRLKSKKVRGHVFHNVLRVHEHATVPKPDDVEFKTYARGVGVITEANNGVGLVGCR